MIEWVCGMGLDLLDFRCPDRCLCRRRRDSAGGSAVCCPSSWRRPGPAGSSWPASHLAARGASRPGPSWLQHQHHHQLTLRRCCPSRCWCRSRPASSRGLSASAGPSVVDRRRWAAHPWPSRPAVSYAAPNCPSDERAAASGWPSPSSPAP